VLKYAAEDGLVIVDDLSEWNLDPDLYSRPYTAEDRLIDSAGVEYRVLFDEATSTAHARLQPTGKTYPADEFQDLAARHLRTIGAPDEWLAAHLSDIPDSHRVRVALQYLTRLGDAKGGGDDGEEEGE
jgi:protein structure with unknown function